ncbi:MAG: hypothetical protein N4A63_17080 [Vallitalea sp.]|jgi:hypothetical protein|nr:hypothetical protein [Vallitalea sp.]
MKKILIIICLSLFLVSCGGADNSMLNETVNDIQSNNKIINNDSEQNQDKNNEVDSEDIDKNKDNKEQEKGNSKQNNIVDQRLDHIDGYEVIRQKEIKIVTTNVKFREKPDISSESIKHKFYCNDFEDELDYFVKGTYLIVTAYTVEEFEVNGIKNHWYYINDIAPNNKKYEGWVFGEYIQPVQKIYLKPRNYDLIVKDSIFEESNAIYTLQKNIQYLVEDIIIDNNKTWYLINLNNNQKGWVRSKDCEIIIFDENGNKDVANNLEYEVVDNYIYISSQTSTYVKPLNSMDFKVICSDDSTEYKIVKENNILIYPAGGNKGDIILYDIQSGEKIVIDTDVSSGEIKDSNLHYLYNFKHDTIKCSINLDNLIVDDKIKKDEYPFNEATIYVYDDYAIYNNNIMYKNKTKKYKDFYYYRYEEYKEPNIYIDSGYFVDKHRRLRNIGEEKKILGVLKDSIYQYDYSDRIIAYIGKDDHYLYVKDRISGEETRITDYKVDEVRVFNEDEVYYKKHNITSLYCYNNSKELKVIDKDIVSYEVLGRYIYFIDKTNNLYRRNIGNSNNIIELFDVSVNNMFKMNNHIYYSKRYEDYNVIYTANNEVKKGKYITLVSELDNFFGGRGKIYYYDSSTYTHLYSIEPKQGQLLDDVIYEDEKYGAFISYKDWDKILYIYNKNTDRVNKLFNSIYDTDTKIYKDWIYAIEQYEMNIYRGNIATDKKECIYNNATDDLKFDVINNDKIILLFDETHTLQIYDINSRDNKLISNKCAELLFEYNNEYYYLTVDNTIMKANLENVNNKGQVSLDNIKLGQMYSCSDDSIYCMLVRGNNSDDFIIYITTNGDLIKYNLIDNSRIKIGENCSEIIKGMSERYDYNYIYYVDLNNYLYRASESSNEKISEEAILPLEDRYDVDGEYIYYMVSKNALEKGAKVYKYNVTNGKSELVVKTDCLITNILVKDGELYVNYHRGGSW